MSKFNIQSYQVSSSDYTHQSLSGGKYNVPETLNRQLIEFMIQNPQFCLCEKLPKKFPLYFDIDGLEDYEINEILDFLYENVNEYFNEKNVKMYILNNKVKENNYHIYFPDLIVNKIKARFICNILNKELENDVFDSNAYNSCFRLPYTGKYDRRKEKKLDIESKYVFTETLYNKFPKSYNLVDKILSVSIRISCDKDETELSKKLKNELSKNNTTDINSVIDAKNIDISNIKNIDEKELSNRDKYYQHELTKNNNHFLNHILDNCLKNYRRDDYKEWIKMIYIFKNTKLPISELISWSKKSEKFDHHSINKINEIVNKRELKNVENKQVGFKTLLSMAIEDNANEFKKIKFGVSKYEYFELTFSIQRIKTLIHQEEKGMAILANSLLKNRIVCDSSLKKPVFHYWDGDLWKEDIVNYIIFIISDFLCSALFLLKSRHDFSVEKATGEKDHLLSKEEEGLLKNLIRRVHTITFIGNIKKWLISMHNDMQIIKKFDKNPDVLSVQNGLIELKTGKLRPRFYNDYNTFFLDVDYNGLSTDVSDIDKFFSSIMVERDEMVKFNQKFLGYSITGHTDEQRFAIWNGNGSNGKSLTIQLLEELLEEGKYFNTLSGDALSTKIKGGAATTMYNGLEGARLVFLDESDKNQELNEGIIKRFSGQSTIKIRSLYGEERPVKLKCQIILATNHLPKITDDPALHRRLLYIPFDAKFVDSKKLNKFKGNKKYKLKLTSQKLKEMISKEKLLVWLVQGAMLWYKEKLEDIPDVIKNITESYLIESDPLLDFIAEKYNEDEDSKISLSQFKEDYETYTNTVLTLKEFKKELKTKDICIKKIKGIEYVLNYTLSNNTE